MPGRTRLLRRCGLSWRLPRSGGNQGASPRRRRAPRRPVCRRGQLGSGPLLRARCHRGSHRSPIPVELLRGAARRRVRRGSMPRLRNHRCLWALRPMQRHARYRRHHGACYWTMTAFTPSPSFASPATGSQKATWRSPPISSCRSAARCWGLQAPLLLQSPAQNELDLRVEAAQIVARPPLQAVEHRTVDPEQEGLALGHRVPIDRACRCSRPAAPRGRSRAPRAGCSPSPPCVPRRVERGCSWRAAPAPCRPCRPRPPRCAFGRR